MGLEAKFTDDFVKSALNQGLEESKDILIQSLIRLGIQGENRAKNNGSYTDRTGNLRSSVGFLVADNGQIIMTSLPDMAMEYVNEVMQSYQEGIVLLVFAGMNYASYVQSKGYDVLASARLAFESDMNRIINQLGNGNGN